MNPYHNALKKKKFEGLSIHIQPHGQAIEGSPAEEHGESPAEEAEEMRRDANNGDGAPTVMDKDPQQSHLHQDAAQAGHMQSENEVNDESDNQPVSHEPPHPGAPNSHIGHTQHRNTSLREKLDHAAKKKGY